MNIDDKNINSLSYSFQNRLSSIETNNPNITLDSSQIIDIIGRNVLEKSQCVSHLTIDTPVEIIENDAFSNLDSLTFIKINKDIKTIGNNAFSNTGVQQLYLKTNITSEWSNSVFANNTKLYSVEINNDIECIPSAMFKGCSNLSNVSWKGVKCIYDNAFEGCINLEYIEIPENCVTLCDFVFKDCTALKRIKLPDKLKYISNSAFYNTAIEELTLPANLSNDIINFENMPCLKQVNIKNNNAYINLPDNVKLVLL